CVARTRRDVHNERAVCTATESPGHRPMKILVCHNFYRDPGGEDQVVPATIELLRARGHHVIELLADNSEIGAGVLAQAAVGARLLVSPAMIRRTVELVEAEQPDVAHVHNVFSQLTPSLYT